MNGTEDTHRMTVSADAVLMVHMDAADFERLRKDWSARHPGMLRRAGRFTAGSGRELNADWDWSEVHYFGEDYAALLLARAYIAAYGFRAQVAYDNHGDDEGLPNGWCILTDYEEQR